MHFNDLTINELAEIQSRPNPDKVLHHYKASIREFQSGEFHVCDLCRKQKLQQFFRDFDSMTDANAQEVQEMAFKLGVTPDEWRTEAQRKDRIEMARYNEGPFIKESF